MTEADVSFLIRIAGTAVVVIFGFMNICMIGGFTAARLMGLPVDVDKFYGVFGPAYFIILNNLMVVFAVDKILHYLKERGTTQPQEKK